MPPFELQGELEAGQVALRIVHVGLRHFDIVQADHGKQVQVQQAGLLADHLPVHLAVRRHVDDHVPQQAGLAGQAPARFEPVLLVILRLDRAATAEMVLPGADAVLGELPLGAQDLAAAAHGPPAADRIQVNVQGLRRLEERGAGLEFSTLAAGEENDFGRPLGHAG
jgi:hypothetical protein